jgi:hypothetical protein
MTALKCDAYWLGVVARVVLAGKPGGNRREGSNQ